MPKVSTRGDAVAYQLLDFLGFWEATFVLAGKDELSVEPELKNPSGSGLERDFAEIIDKCGEEFLTEPSSSQQPSTLLAVSNGYSGELDVGICHDSLLGAFADRGQAK